MDARCLFLGVFSFNMRLTLVIFSVKPSYFPAFPMVSSCQVQFAA